jgi:hypothetical protein
MQETMKFKSQKKVWRASFILAALIVPLFFVNTDNDYSSAFHVVPFANNKKPSTPASGAVQYFPPTSPTVGE